MLPIFYGPVYLVQNEERSFVIHYSLEMFSNVEETKKLDAICKDLKKLQNHNKFWNTDFLIESKSDKNHVLREVDFKTYI